MRISIIGAGNVGGLTAMRLAEEGFDDVVLVDIAKGLASGKALDLEDSAAVLKRTCHIQGADDIKKIKGSDIIIITAGLARKPGMAREDLLNKNAQVLKDICLDIKKLSGNAIVITVTNPLDLMTYLALKILESGPDKIFGMGVSLDAARLTNLISKQLNIPNSEIEACVIGSHGEGMLPLSRFTTIRGVGLDEFIGKDEMQQLAKRTLQRGQEIVTLLGSGSAYFAPSLAIAAIVKIIAKDEKRTVGVSAYLGGEYGVKDICIGVPCRLGREGIEKIIELDLNKEEKTAFLASVGSLRENLEAIKPFYDGL